tara:strand:+ start:39876 stop:40352 length:477 start_codon:yes stop_codon:yes gene_type:complete
LRLTERSSVTFAQLFGDMRILLSLIGIGLSLCVMAQEENKWELLQQQDGVKFYWTLSNCDLPSDGQYANYYLIKIENTNDSEIKVRWKNEIFYNGQCRNCNENYLPQFQTIKANSELVGDCSPYTNQYLRVFHSWNNKPNKDKLTGFRISNITIQTPH